ncbi:MAG: hypothetical protein P8K14_06030 [Flavobacteriaceae bacterium]|jgi:hypothetical protein|nr:hypothetical protein [Flavobacteriaceae bacterium]
MKLNFLLALILLFSCKKEVIPDPEAVILSSPGNGDSCTTALNIDLEESQVTFSWKQSLHTDSYEININNLDTGEMLKKGTVLNSESIILKRGFPYSWWVFSKSENSPIISKSQIWVFYLEGHSKSSYLPFPAKLISPGSEEQVNLDNGRFIFQWEGRDLDNDIISFDFYIGEDIDELKLINSGLTGTSIEIELEVGKNYYWKIITTDSKGNTSSSLGSFSTSA